MYRSQAVLVCWLSTKKSSQYPRLVLAAFFFGYQSELICSNKRQTGSDSMALLSRSASLSLLALLYQPLVLTSTSIIKSQVEKLDFRPLSVPFPCNFQLINIRPLTRGGEQSQSLLILHRVGVDCDISEDKSELRCDSGTDVSVSTIARTASDWSVFLISADVCAK